MAVEADEGAALPRPGGGPPVPPQLLFVHQVRGLLKMQGYSSGMRKVKTKKANLC